jgi:pyridoxamine 5'-phosphate oxidase
MATDPILRFHRWFAQATRAGVRLPEAMALATADRRGTPTVRYVLLKEVTADGFVFFTDARSRKGRDLADRLRASLAFYWDATGKQVRIEGRIVAVSAADADGYWETRPRPSRVAGSVSIQSRPMPSHAWLLTRWRRLRRAVGRGPIPRPATWVGYRLVPDAIEFWSRRAYRLHLRERFERTQGRWRKTILQP